MPEADADGAELGPVSEASILSARLRASVRDERVLHAIAGLAREHFVPAAQRDRAYENVALPIDCGQTISQPLVVARMLELLELRGDERVLDVGTGSGYHAALLAMLTEHVWTIERHAKLSAAAQRTVSALGLENLTFVVGDGSAGLAKQAPFDAINVAAAVGESLPDAIEQQLALAGLLVAPVGVEGQHLMQVRRTRSGFRRRTLDPVRFVPLVRDH
jgi:protein-L-isoaspartate(D-aspartate) O-methyltransferase